jgi:MoaA/NifB/PqqE/SkfB family radical SAM enzyme
MNYNSINLTNSMLRGIDFKDYTATLKRVFKREEDQLAISEEKVAKRTILSEDYTPPTFPPLVQVGISNVCNLGCPQCYYPKYSKKPDFTPLFMEIGLYKKVVDEMRQFPSNTVLRFLGRGESLIHPRIIEFISYAKEQLKGPVALITNGHLLNPERSTDLLNTGIDVLDISVDAATTDTYSLVRGKNFERLITNINDLVSLRDHGNFSTKVMLSFLIQPENYKEAEDFRELWEGVVDKVIFRKYHSYAGRIQEKPCLSKQRTPCPALWNKYKRKRKDNPLLY